MLLTVAQIVEMKEASMPLMEWLERNCHPHVHAIVNGAQVEIVEGLAMASRVEHHDFGAKNDKLEMRRGQFETPNV